MSKPDQDTGQSTAGFTLLPLTHNTHTPSLKSLNNQRRVVYLGPTRWWLGESFLIATTGWKEKKKYFSGLSLLSCKTLKLNYGIKYFVSIVYYLL